MAESVVRAAKYVFEQKFFRENLKLGPGGQTGEDNRLLQETFERTGVSIMDKRMFDDGARFWPEGAPFHTPVFVLTNQVRTPWERKGGTTFHFINDGVESALARAREVAQGRDIRIAGGAYTIQEYLNAGLVDDFHIALAPVYLGSGIKLFDRIDANRVALEIVRSINSRDGHAPDVRGPAQSPGPVRLTRLRGRAVKCPKPTISRLLVQ